MDNARKIKLFGDRPEAMRKLGEGQALLRATKAISELLGLPYYRLFSADKSVMAQSIPGVQDQIILSHEPEVPIEEEKKPYCSINFINLPEEIPPMKWYAPGQETFTKVDGAWVIKDPSGVVEVEGVDYLKTYYRLNITDCNECSPFISTVCKTEELVLARCHPYKYDATKLLYLNEPVPFFEGFPDRNPPVPPDPENHLIYSLTESGQAEILKFGSDSQGSYFLWKAYTEWGTYPPTSISFSRTGLGYLFLKAFIMFEGRDLCKAQSIVKVDCCVKDISRRRIKQPDRPGYSGLWWESDSSSFPQNCFNQPFMFYGSMKMCEVPSEISILDLFIMACIPVNPVAFYVLPDIFGSCLPFTWTLTGPGIWTPGGIYGEIGYYGCAEIECHQDITITVKDRCDTTTTVHAKSCCETTGALSISYTSLLMSCDHSQELTALGGCSPWSWSLSGGGSLSGSVGKSVTYTAPETNVNCLDNPTITVTDCCGNSASISLAVNCYVSTGEAYGHDEYLECEGCWKDPRGIDQGFTRCWDLIVQKYNCDGTLLSYCETKPCGTYSPHCPPNQGNWIQADCDEIPLIYAPCWTNQCGCACQGLGGCMCTWSECRTAAMKTQGCCPINPVTGLPF